MTVYVHREGQNLGPYSIAQLRPYLAQGSFKEDDLACHDGTNWISLKDVPGVIREKTTHKVKADKKKKGPSISKKTFIFLSSSVLIFSLAVIPTYFFLKQSEVSVIEQSRTPSGLLEIKPEQVVEVYDGDTFKIDLPEVHPLFGKRLPIRLKGIDTPEMRGTSEEIKVLAEQARELTERALKSAKAIELRNPERGKYFRIVAEVWVDGKPLAELLKEEGLAKDYDGEGKRPEW
jgi:endonuclease YncB( thermonuclease family)